MTRRHKSKLPANGQCYQKALSYLFEITKITNSDRYRLVHGTLIIKNIPEGHAWVEIKQIVIDPSYTYKNGEPLSFPKKIFYEKFNIRRTVEFTVDEANLNVIRYRHYGPWDSKLDSL